MSTLADIMTSDPYTTEAETPVAEVAKAMVRRRFGSVLVVQGPALVGILTERDVLRAAASGEELVTSPVSKWMTPDPETAEPGLACDDAAEMMLSRGFRHLPVMRGDRPIGIVSLRDVLSSHIRRR